MIAAKSYWEWPAYDSTPLYDRSSLNALKEDIRTVARGWFDHDAHESLEDFVCCLPLTYVKFEAHDRYRETTRYEMSLLRRSHWALFRRSKPCRSATHELVLSS